MLIYMGSWLGSLKLWSTLLDCFVTAVRHPNNFSCNPIPHISQAVVFVFPDFTALCFNYGQKKNIREGYVLICLSTAVLTGIYFKVIIGIEIAMKKWSFPANNLRHLVYLRNICRPLLTQVLLWAIFIFQPLLWNSLAAKTVFKERRRVKNQRDLQC